MRTRIAYDPAMTPAAPVRDDTSSLIDRMREQVLAADNTHCFVEREDILARCAEAWRGLPQPERYTRALATLLDGLSTPIEDDDVFLGRMVEGAPRWQLKGIAGGGSSHPADPFGIAGRMRGHMTLDYGALLREGLRGIAEQCALSAEGSGGAEARAFAGRLGECVAAVCRFAERFAHAARLRASHVEGPARDRLTLAAEALGHVPAHSPRSFFEALQSIWLVHLVMSCIVGGRDFAFGRFDQYLLPFYRRDVGDCTLTREQAVGLLACFFVKTNVLSGTASFAHKPKPVPCAASKQYLVLGGTAPDGAPVENELSLAVLRAAMLVRLPEPDLFIRYSPRSGPAWKRAVAQAVSALQGQVQIIHDELAVGGLVRSGVPEDRAWDFTASGCCRPDFPGQQSHERYHNAVGWLVRALAYGPEVVQMLGAVPESMDRILAEFQEIARQEMAKWKPAAGNDGGFHFESALLRDCVKRCGDFAAGGEGLHTCCHFFGGIATLANSLAAIDRVLRRGGRTALAEFLQVVAQDFVGHETMAQELRHRYPKFGNDDPEADQWARRAGLALVAALPPPTHDTVSYGGFFSLTRHNDMGRALPATPDGRRAGQPFSENQSPVVGTDVRGPTALLRSLGNLPFDRAPAGGLNLRFATTPSPDFLAAMIDTYFTSLGGLHVGLTFVNAATLRAARQRPAEYRSLAVRITGFSEFFVRLSPEMQDEVLRRTEHQG
jgi:formate C-acetyltransferase